MRDRKAARVLAQQWERAAKRKRAAQTPLPRKPVMRVRPDSGERELGLLTQREVGLIMKISTRAVREIERRAFNKIRQHPALRDFWREGTTGEVKETTSHASGPWLLSQAEIAAHVVAYQLIRYRVPIYFIDQQFVRAVAATNLPHDFTLNDLHWPMPAMVVGFPAQFMQEYLGFPPDIR